MAVAATVFMALATTLLAGAAVSPAEAAETAVKIGNFTFGPRQVTVPAGTTVVWTNEDDIPHTVTSTTKTFSSPPLTASSTSLRPPFSSGTSDRTLSLRCTFSERLS